MSVDAPPRRDERFPTDVEYRDLLDRRTRRARVFQVVSLLALTTGVVALATLIYTIVNDSFGWVAVVNAREPEEVVEDLGFDPAEVSLADIPYDDLVGSCRRRCRRESVGDSSASNGSTRTASSSRLRLPGTRCVHRKARRWGARRRPGTTPTCSP